MRPSRSAAARHLPVQSSFSCENHVVARSWDITKPMPGRGPTGSRKAKLRGHTHSCFVLSLPSEPLVRRHGLRLLALFRTPCGDTPPGHGAHFVDSTAQGDCISAWYSCFRTENSNFTFRSGASSHVSLRSRWGVVASRSGIRVQSALPRPEHTRGRSHANSSQADFAPPGEER